MGTSRAKFNHNDKDDQSLEGGAQNTLDFATRRGTQSQGCFEKKSKTCNTINEGASKEQAALTT